MSMFFIVYAKDSFHIDDVRHVTKSEAHDFCESLKVRYPFSCCFDKSRCAEVQVLNRESGYFLVKANGVAGAQDKVARVLENRELIDWVKDLRIKGYSELGIARKTGYRNTSAYREGIVKEKAKADALLEGAL